MILEFFGKMNICLFIIMFLDFITGIMVAYKEKKLNSSIGYLGILKKIAIIFIVILVTVLSKAIFNSNEVIILVQIFYIVNESLSIMENCGNLGIELPDYLKMHLEQIKENQ